MINTEILAITAIFLGGFYMGLKVKEGLNDLKQYIRNNRN